MRPSLASVNNPLIEHLTTTTPPIIKSEGKPYSVAGEKVLLRCWPPEVRLACRLHLRRPYRTHTAQDCQNGRISARAKTAGLKTIHSALLFPDFCTFDCIRSRKQECYHVPSPITLPMLEIIQNTLLSSAKKRLNAQVIAR